MPLNLKHTANIKSTSFLHKNKSHDTSVLNPELNFALCINMKSPVLIQATCQTVDLDSFVPERAADEKTVCVQYS